MTPFRKSQARAVLEGVVRTLAPQMQTPDGLREAVAELAADRALWVELEQLCRPLPAHSLPRPLPTGVPP